MAAAAASIDVDWLLRSKTLQPSKDESPSPPLAPAPGAPTPPESPTSVAAQGTADGPAHSSPSPSTPPPTIATTNNQAPPSKSAQVRPPSSPPKGQSGSQKKDKQLGRRSSWISSLSSKFGGSSDPKRQAQASPTADANSTTSNNSAASTTTTTRPSPEIEFGNPFELRKDVTPPEKKDENKVVVVGPTTPIRRQTVLVAAGKETKLESPGFLSSALRRLSSSHGSSTKSTNYGAIQPRRVMNVDRNRPRTKITELDQNKLRRVAFCVDVEIAGYAAHGDEEDVETTTQPSPAALAGARAARASLSAASIKGDGKDAKRQEKGEGAALKTLAAIAVATELAPLVSSPVEQAKEAVKRAESDAKGNKSDPEAKEGEKAAGSDAQLPSQGPPPAPGPISRKKEKKKRSEAERKERKERRRRHAEQNGLVPLELRRENEEEYDSESTPNSTPPGASTPAMASGSATTDPLRIYKRCCQLRESNVLNAVKEQISKPSATLAEAPGTVAVVDLSGAKMQLQDITTLGDWLAIVPVRKLVLNDCNLSDEAVRVILSALAGCKSNEQIRANRKLPKRSSGSSSKPGREQMGVIEKLSLKNNPDLTEIGWTHIALFLHLSTSIKAIDLSGIPFPKPITAPSTTLDRTVSVKSHGGGRTTAAKDPPPPANQTMGKIGQLFPRAIAERLGDRLEELILGSCALSDQTISDIVDAAIKTKIRRLGLASNRLNEATLAHVVRYVKSGVCEGLDLGGNDLHGSGHLASSAVDEDNPLFAISFADCNLDSTDLAKILKPMTVLKNLKFVDLSQNHNLFSGPKNAVPALRKLLPQLKELKRFHLADCGLTPDHVIAIAEILPDCPSLCHISILGNPALIKAMNSKEEASQEEACAYFASLMTAVRVSSTIVAIEIEVPSTEASEVVKALASQVAAYSLRNMERGVEEFGVKSNTIPDKDAPEVLLHLVGHMEGYGENHDQDDPPPDQDYVIASSGIVKALSVCLGSRDGSSRTHTPLSISPTQSGTSTPIHGIHLRPKTHRKPRDVSLELCESARKIRMRLRPALIREDKDGNDVNYRRLIFLDQTLQRMIQRFEDEYPQTKLSSLPSLVAANGDANKNTTTNQDDEPNHVHVTNSAPLPNSNNTEAVVVDEDDQDPHAVRLSRASSTTSLAAKEYTNEEGRMFRFGQNLRRELLKPHLARLRAGLEGIDGDRIRQQVLRDGPQKVIDDIGMKAR
ncbi:hypothetical protein DV735_g578, partial [Chaetothyriales sp. CBS 134920]